MTHHVIKSALEVSYQGVPYSYVDRTGRFPIWKILKLLESGYDILSLGEWHLPKNAVSAVVVHQVTRIDPEFYRNVDLFSQIRLSVERRFVDIRKFSVVVSKLLRDPQTDKAYVQDFTKSVSVIRDSMTPTPIDENLLQKYKKYLITGMKAPEAVHARTFLTEPDVNVHKYKITVSYSDLDRLFHTNHTNYVKFCMECACSATLKGFYKHFTGDMGWYPIEEVDIQYIGESKANDELVVSTWQNGDNIRNLYFVITLNGEAICQASLLFSLERTPITYALGGKL